MERRRVRTYIRRPFFLLRLGEVRYCFSTSPSADHSRRCLVVYYSYSRERLFILLHRGYAKPITPRRPIRTSPLPPSLPRRRRRRRRIDGRRPSKKCRSLNGIRALRKTYTSSRVHRVYVVRL